MSEGMPGGRAPGGRGERALKLAAEPDSASTLTRARAGIHAWIARAGRGLLHATPAALITAMTAAALAPVLLPLLAGAAGAVVLSQVLSQLGNIGAEHLTDVMQDVITRLRSEAKVAGVSEETVQNVLERRLDAELAGPNAAAFRSEITRLLRAVNGVGTALDAAFRSEVEGLDAHIGQAVGELSESVAEFRALREDVLSGLADLQGDITRTLAVQRSHSKKLDRLNIQLALLRRELVFSRPAPAQPSAGAGPQAPAPPPGPTAPPGTAVPPGTAAPPGTGPGAPATGPAAAGPPAAGPPAAGAVATGPVAGQLPAAAPQPALCPYPGLAAFNETDAFWFHGRERLTAALVNRLRERLAGPAPLLVVGASGAGKSSVLRAGLIPELDTGALAEPGSADWPREIMTPGPYPLRDLALRLGKMAELPASVVLDQLAEDPDRTPLIIAQAVLTREERRRRGVVTVTPNLDLASQPSGGEPPARRRLILVIDQFEEVFTQCQGDERKQFIDAVCAAARGSRADPPPALVVISVRAGFVEHCTAHPPLEPALRDPFIVGPMTPRELHAAIEAPARDAELTVEPGLAATMLGDIGAVTSAGSPHTATYDPGALPLLAHALRETWERREGTLLTIRAYQDAGGIKEAVAKKAGDVYHSLDPASQLVARHLLEHMISVRADSEDTRRRMSRTALLAELPAGDVERAGQVLDLLELHRLVTADHDIVQIAHEALLRHWPLLAGWLEENRAWLRARQRLTEHAHEWDDDDRHPDRLLHGAQLSAVHDQLIGTRRATLGELETAFLRASERWEARARSIRTAFTATLALALLVAATFAVVAQRNSSAARQQRAIAQSRQLAAEADALRASDPATSLLLSLEAFRVQATAEAASSLLSAQSGYFSARLHSPSGPVNSVAYDPAAPAVLASAGQGSVITLWDTRTHQRTAGLRGDSPFYAVAFSGDGRWLAGAEQNGSTVVWDTRSRRQLAVLPGDGASVDTVAFSPGERLLATAGYDGNVTLWRAGSWRAAGKLRVSDGTISGVAFSPDGTRLAAACADHEVRLWDLHEPGSPRRILRGHTALVRAVAFSQRSGLLASGGDDGTIRLWDARTGAARGVLPGGTAPVRSLAFSPDGRQLASGGEDDAVRVWNVGTQAPAAVLTGPAGTVAGVAFSPDGRTVASADADATIGIWNVTALPPPGSPATPAVASAPASGGEVATAGSGSGIDLWDPRQRVRRPVRWQGGGSPRTAAPGGSHVAGISFSPDGHLLVVTDRKRLTLYDVRTGRRVQVLHAPTPAIAAAYRPAARGLPTVTAAGLSNNEIYLWGLAGAPAEPISRQFGPVDAVVFSPGGQWLAAGSDDGTIITATVASSAAGLAGTVRDQASGHLGSVEAVAFSPDGRTLASASSDHTVKLWQVSGDGRLSLEATLTGPSQAVISVSFSSDGRTLAASSDDRTIMLWDVRDPARPAPLATLAGLHTATTVAFVPGTHTVVGAAWDGTALFWDTQPGQVADRVCASHPAGAVTALEPFLHSIPYRPICPASHH